MSIGKKLADVWPDDMSVRMDPEKPKDVKLLDYISNYEKVVLVSPKLRDFLRAQELRDVEYLPVAILDHKKRIASRDYSIVNSVRVIDAVNQEKSDFRWDGLENPSMVVTKIVLNDESLGDEDKLIRLRFVPGKILFREDLMRAIEAATFSGVAFTRRAFGDFEVYGRR